MTVQIEDQLAREALVTILLIETSQKFSAVPEKVRRGQVIKELGGERAKAEEALETLKRLKCVRFVLFGCVELTTSGRLTALQLSRG